MVLVVTTKSHDVTNLIIPRKVISAKKFLDKNALYVFQRNAIMNPNRDNANRVNSVQQFTSRNCKYFHQADKIGGKDNVRHNILIICPLNHNVRRQDFGQRHFLAQERQQAAG